MSVNAFERKVSLWLKNENVWSYHPTDMGFGKPFLPADFIVVSDGVTTLIECKSVQTGQTFPLSRWPANQRQSLVNIIGAGGHYILLIQYEEHGVTAAFRPVPTISGVSLHMSTGRLVTKQTFHTILDGSLGWT